MYNQEALNQILKDAGDISEETRQLVIDAYRKGADAHRYEVDFSSQTFLEYESEIRELIHSEEFEDVSNEDIALIDTFLNKVAVDENKCNTLISIAQQEGYITSLDIRKTPFIEEEIKRTQKENIITFILFLLQRGRMTVND